MRQYTIVREPAPEEGGYTVVVPALPECVTQGETVEERIERATEAIAGYVEILEAHRAPVPEETGPPRMIAVMVAA